MPNYKDECPGCICCGYGVPDKSRDREDERAATRAKLGAHKGIVCPSCLSSQGPYRLVEEIKCWRLVYGFGPAGQLLVGSSYHTGDGYDDGENMRMQCCNCWHEFSIPADVLAKAWWS